MNDEDRLNYDRYAEQAGREQNPWIAFSLLKEKLGNDTYTAQIREAMSSATSCEIPHIYRQLWRLRLGGLLSLNIDRLVTRAYVEELNDSTIPTEFCGTTLAGSEHVLKSPLKFIGHLHGQIDSTSSWIMTGEQLRGLLTTPAYDKFVNSIFLTRTVIFVGISVDDIAVGGFLDKLAKDGLSTGPHFWLTNRRDAMIDKWAEDRGIQVIRYHSENGQHKELETVIQALIDHVPQDVSAIPVKPLHAPPFQSNTLTVDDVMNLSTNDKRKYLSAIASKILGSDSPAKYTEYGRALNDLDEVVHHAWYVSQSPSETFLFDYILQSRIAGGAFGNVYTAYRATDLAKATVAIKVLHENVRSKPGWLESFRRGAAAMRILTNANVKGVVKCIDAHEVPACVIMEYVEGPSVRDAIDKKRLEDWRRLLTVAVSLVDIVKSSHSLPEHVLHRDIRPSNIIIRNGWDDDYTAWEVVVLDFDLAWHKEAVETSIPAAGTGFIAPEQVNRQSGVSTRNALVDSYGIGMTLFAMRTSTDPTFNQAAHTDWEDTLRTMVGRFGCTEWRSLPNRFWRLIQNATRTSQRERWDITQIRAELLRLLEASDGRWNAMSAEIVAEEIAARGLEQRYAWDQTTLCASSEQPGFTCKIAGLESSKQVKIVVRWGYNSAASQKRPKNKIEDLWGRIRAALRRLDGEVVVNSDATKFEVVGVYPVGSCNKCLDTCEGVVRDIVSHFSSFI